MSKKSNTLTAYRIHVTQEEFDDYLYPAFASVGSQNDQEAETALRAAKLFREGPTMLEEVTAEEEEKKKVAMYKLVIPEHTFTVESDIYTMLKKRYKKYMGQLRDAVIIEKMEFKSKLEGAKEIEIDPESADERQSQQAS